MTQRVGGKQRVVKTRAISNKSRRQATRKPSLCDGDANRVLPLFEIARVLVRLDQIAGFVVNVSHGIESSTIKRAFG